MSDTAELIEQLENLREGLSYVIDNDLMRSAIERLSALGEQNERLETEVQRLNERLEGTGLELMRVLGENGALRQALKTIDVHATAICRANGEIASDEFICDRSAISENDGGPNAGRDLT